MKLSALRRIRLKLYILNLFDLKLVPQGRFLIPSVFAALPIGKNYF